MADARPAPAPSRRRTATRADENLKLDDLYKATEVVALSLADLLRPA